MHLSNCSVFSTNLWFIHKIAELPFGWEEVNDKVLGKYFIDHNTGIFMNFLRKVVVDRTKPIIIIIIILFHGSSSSKLKNTQI